MINEEKEDKTSGKKKIFFKKKRKEDWMNKKGKMARKCEEKIK